MRGTRVVGLAATLALTAATGTFAASAQAADSVWWTNSAVPYGISWTALDGSTAGDFSAADLIVTYPTGLAIDAAAGRIYWAELTPAKLAWADLDGTVAGAVATPGVSLVQPRGVAIDPAAGLLYVANSGRDKISYVRLDGSGGGDLAVGSATVDRPIGVAIDPAAGRIYWANYDAGRISWARLDGSGGGDITTTGATITHPDGVAVDPAARRVYWSNVGARTSDKIAYASLDGSGGQDLNTTGASVIGPEGLALDAAAGRVYWANVDEDAGISYARTDGSGGANLPVLSAAVHSSYFPVLFKAPTNTAAPVVTGSATVGSALSCTGGTWAPDLLPSLLYRAPQTLSYGWSRNGSLISGQTARTVQTAQAGSYACIVTATNAAGAAKQTSAAVTVGGPGTPGEVRVRITRVSGHTLMLFTSVGGALSITARGLVTPISASADAGDHTYTFRLTPAAKKRLELTGRATLRITVKLTPAGGGPAVYARKSVPITN